MAITLEQEYYSDKLVDEIVQLAKNWWAQLSPYALNVDKELCKKVFDLGLLKFYTCRSDEVLIGYGIFTVTKSPFTNRIAAQAESVYVNTMQRHGLLGYKLVKYCIACLKAEGIKTIMFTSTVEKDISKLLTRLGCEKVADLFLGDF